MRKSSSSVQGAQNSKGPARLLAVRGSQWLVLPAIGTGFLNLWFDGSDSFCYCDDAMITIFITPHIGST